MSINWIHCSEEKRIERKVGERKLEKWTACHCLSRETTLVHIFLREIYIFHRVLHESSDPCGRVVFGEEIWRVVAFISTIFPRTIHNALRAGDKSV